MKSSIPTPFPSSLESLRKETLEACLNQLRESYTPADLERFTFCSSSHEETVTCVGAGSANSFVVGKVLTALQEMVVPGIFMTASESAAPGADLEAALLQVTDCLYTVLLSFYRLECEEPQCSENSALAALHLISQLPSFRQRSQWNIFASRKDPALWDSFILRNEKRCAELGRLYLIAAIDHAIQTRDQNSYRDCLDRWGFGYAYDYHQKLIEHTYPGWRALLMHDMAHALAVGGQFAEGRGNAGPAPILPRLIGQQAASLFQTDLHPETVIGDANFLDHPHRGITTGQTGSIGVGCVIYPCTLGGITDKVKLRHPAIGDFVLIGTDVGIYGPVTVANHAVIGANTEINGMVEIKEKVKIRAAVVARTVISESGKPGKIVFSEGVTVGEECLIVNDHPTDLIIPPRKVIPAGTHLINDGKGKPKAG